MQKIRFFAYLLKKTESVYHFLQRASSCFSYTPYIKKPMETPEIAAG